MRLQVLSDLHLEFDSYEPKQTSADVVILAGDISVGREGLNWAKSSFDGKPVVYVLGNHEFYLYSIPELTKTLKREAKDSQVHVLENNSIQVDGFTILGCTLWTDFQLWPRPVEAMQVANRGMKDFSLIGMENLKRRFRSLDSARFHDQSMRWLERRLTKCDRAKTIIVTHHAPCLRSISPHQASGVLSAAFTSRLDEFIAASGVPLWIHGHTHYNCDYQIGVTRVYSNQRGYPAQKLPGFQPEAVLEV